MRSISSNYSRAMALSALVISLTTGAGACRSGTKHSNEAPEFTAAANHSAVAAFYVGLAALQTGDDSRAEDKLIKVTELAPQEPAAWANLGLLALRRREFEVASERLKRAVTLAPKNSVINLYLGLLEINRERSSEAISYLRRASDLDPSNAEASFTLAKEMAKQGGATNDSEAQRVLERILESQPNNLAVQLEVALLASKSADRDSLQPIIERLAQEKVSWPPEIQEHFNALKDAAAASDFTLITTRIMFLRNVLVRLPEFRQGLAMVQSPPDRIAEPISHLLFLPPSSEAPAPADDSLRFAPEPVQGARGGAWGWSGCLLLREEWTPSIVMADSRKVLFGGGITLSFPGGRSAPPLDAVCGLDFDYDFQTDIALAGAGGFKLYLPGRA